MTRSTQERRRTNAGSCAIVTRQLSKIQVTDIHQKSGHPGVKRTLYFVRIIDLTVSKELVRSVVRACEACQSIDLELVC